MDPLVSVLIPNYNYSKYLNECISSVLNQTYKNLDIVILDNDSSDDSVKLCKKFDDPRLRVCINQYNIISLSYNLLADMLYDVRSEYAVLLCSDDSFEPDFIQKAVEILESDKNISYVHGDRWWISPEGEKKELDPFFNCSFTVSGRNMMPLYLVTAIAHPSQGVFRLSAFRKMGGFDQEFTLMHADRTLWYYLSYFGDYGYIRGHMVNIRISGNQSQTSETLRNLQYLTFYYMGLTDFIHFAEAHNLQNVLARKQECMERISRDYTMYAANFILEKDFATAKRYYDFSKIINPAIVKDDMYMRLYDMMKTGIVDEEYVKKANPIVYGKKRSYNPPEGFKIWEC